jgi:Bacteriocin-protection, YdeI or OmpD-Associated
VAKAEALVAAGRMRAAGLAQVAAAKAGGRWQAAYESQRAAAVPPDLAAALATGARAKAAFERLGKSGRYAVILPLLKARTAHTRARITRLRHGWQPGHQPGRPGRARTGDLRERLRGVATKSDCWSAPTGPTVARSWRHTMAMPVLSMLLASPISPPMVATLLGGQVSASWAGQMVSRHGLRAGPAGLTRSMNCGDPARRT